MLVRTSVRTFARPMTPRLVKRRGAGIEEPPIVRIPSARAIPTVIVVGIRRTPVGSVMLAPIASFLPGVAISIAIEAWLSRMRGSGMGRSVRRGLHGRPGGRSLEAGWYGVGGSFE
jgi:hypothetical protein